MKKYTSRATKWLAIAALVSGIILAIGIVFVALDSPNVSPQIGLIALGGATVILFTACLFAERGRYLAIGPDEIIFPRGADKNGKTVFQKIVVKIDEISSIESELYKGDGLIMKDTCFYTLKLKDGIKITFTLYAYGRESEREIIATIRKSIA